MGTIYNKLVRDKIPEIIQSKGEEATWHEVVDEKEFQIAAFNKVGEEFLEFQDTPTIEEAADLVEILYALFGRERLEAARLRKLTEKGGFEGRIILERTEP